jgi:hypothetical protein
MSNELDERKAVVGCFKLLSRNLRGRAEENNETIQSVECMRLDRIELMTCRIEARRFLLRGTVQFSCISVQVRS